jgi:uncharacterized protein YndB with AHSA1/START domain
MTKRAKVDTSHDAPNHKVTIERTYHASIEQLWELWTTRYGLELWWNPDGFAVTINKLDLRSGGEVDYATTATAPEQIERMKAAGLPTTSEHHITYTEVAPRRHIAYKGLADDVPGVDPHVEATDVELHTVAHGVSMVLTIDAVLDPAQTKLTLDGWEHRLDRLAEVLEM